MRSKDMKRIVVNASVARAAGGEDATAFVSINCTEFLESFRDQTPHHIVMTLELSEEWDEHQSNFAAAWLANMIATKRFHYIELSQNRTLHEKIEATAPEEKDINALLKDFHLLGAALAADKTIISLDETVRELFARATQQVSEIRDIIWVNPERTMEEQPITWLQIGAPPEVPRQLFTYPTQ
ncbi:MAG: hypothetical protein OXI67_02130 [Candidatus Poribacteria bacterium]|nr:hypothetical protein [Candidatus Poribacteria bacterium]